MLIVTLNNHRFRSYLKYRGDYGKMLELKNWNHVFKLDPNKQITDADLELICESGTDAIFIGGSDGITEDNIIDLLVRVRRYSVPCVLEVSSLESIVPGFDYYCIPTVLNSNRVEWVTGMHHQAIKEYGPLMNWDEIITEGYCILNQDCKAARLTGANTDLSREDVMSYAMMAEKMFKLPVFYLEYSGTYGDVRYVQAVKNIVEETRLFYGGGIKTPEQAAEMAEYADTVVVGNLIYENMNEALKTVNAVKSK